MTLQEIEPDLPECLGVSSRGVGRQWPSMGPGALTTTVLGTTGISHFEGGHYNNYPYHSLA